MIYKDERTERDKTRASDVWWERFAILSGTGFSGEELSAVWNKHAAYLNMVHKLQPRVTTKAFVSQARRNSEKHPGYKKITVTTPINYYTFY